MPWVVFPAAQLLLSSLFEAVVERLEIDENLKTGEKGCLGVMQRSGKTEEINGGKRRMHVFGFRSGNGNKNGDEEEGGG